MYCEGIGKQTDDMENPRTYIHTSVRSVELSEIVREKSNTSAGPRIGVIATGGSQTRNLSARGRPVF